MPELLLGNEAIARGLMENGCAVAASYPGTPASEILGAVAKLANAEKLSTHVEWAVNEKVAFEIAYAAAITGLRAAVAMKQVGLNVAADPFMSAAYMGTAGGFLVIAADDPGPHSSQTEQDSRLTALSAKVPVLDPESPADAKAMTGLGFILSETFSIPVMLRPTTRVCHARQDVAVSPVPRGGPAPAFAKDPARWAATPKFRNRLHRELTEKLEQIAAFDKTAPVRLNPEGGKGRRAVVTSGVTCAHLREIIEERALWEEISLYKVIQPFPLHRRFVESLPAEYAEILVVEETAGVMELQLADRLRVKGKNTGDVPAAGELLPEALEALLLNFIGRPEPVATLPAAPGRRPTLCAGCPHRAAFFAIRKAAPKGIYTSDIGCYTLGLNLGAVDTVLCMGAAVGQAMGFYHAFKHSETPPDIVATIGDSTFYHAGVPALINAVVQNVRFVLVILDNGTTAMTGSQPTPASGFGARGEPLAAVHLPQIVAGCGVTFCETADPYHLPEFTALLKRAAVHAREHGPAVVIARHPCILDRRYRQEATKIAVTVTEDCDGCGFCVTRFECPAMAVTGEGEEARMEIDAAVCNGCGVCLHICPRESIRAQEGA